MSMIVQTLVVLETENEQSLEDAIVSKFEARKDEDSTDSTVDE